MLIITKIVNIDLQVIMFIFWNSCVDLWKETHFFCSETKKMFFSKIVQIK